MKRVSQVVGMHATTVLSVVGRDKDEGGVDEDGVACHLETGSAEEVALGALHDALEGVLRTAALALDQPPVLCRQRLVHRHCHQPMHRGGRGEGVA